MMLRVTTRRLAAVTSHGLSRGSRHCISYNSASYEMMQCSNSFARSSLFFIRNSTTSRFFSSIGESQDFDEVNLDVENAQEKSAQKNIDDFNLSPKLSRNLRSAGIVSMYPVQSECYDTVMSGKDMICKSRTGSGKTLAFAIPIVQTLQESNRSTRSGKAPFAVVVTPTRELAKQVCREFERIAPELNSIALYGGTSLGPQITMLHRGVDLVVGTPGRIIDHLENRNLDLSSTRFAVLDEADQMLQMGFQDDVEKIFSYLPPNEQRQTMLWSATMPKWVHNIANKYLSNPSFIDMVGADDIKIPSTINHWSVMVTRDNRDDILTQICSVYGSKKRVLIFTRTKIEADSLAALPGMRSLGAEAMHGGLTQAGRERTLERFRSGQTPIVIATDVASRGLDIPNVEVVIHHRLPRDMDSFVHRTGRTGRAGKGGTNIVLISPGLEEAEVEMLEKEYSFKTARVSVPGSEFEENENELVEEVLDVPRNVSAPYRERANRLLKESGMDAATLLSACLSLISRDEAFTSASYSMISGDNGLQTMLAYSPRGVSSRDVRDIFRALDPSCVPPYEFRKTDSHGGGILFDAPAHIASRLLKISELSEDKSDNISEELKAVKNIMKDMTITAPLRLDDGIEMRPGSKNLTRKYGSKPIKVGQVQRGRHDSGRFQSSSRDGNQGFSNRKVAW